MAQDAASKSVRGGTTPELLAILVCDTVIRDAETSKCSLVGLFNRIIAKKFPCNHPQLHVFVSLTNGHGRSPGELQLVHRATGNIVVKLSGPVVFPSPLDVVDLNFELSNLTLPEPGPYCFDFYCHGERIGSRPFDVAQEETEPRNE